jgi:hypothetical protein
LGILLPKFIIKDFIEKFNVLNGQNANVQIKHLLYGNRKLNRCVLRPFVDEERIGLIMDDGEEKYILFDELCEVSIDENEYRIKSDVMELYIIL